MNLWDQYSLFLSPVVALLALAVLGLALRWTFTRGTSLVHRIPQPADPSDYGLLTPIAAAPTQRIAEDIADTIRGHKLRASVVHTKTGWQVMVLADDVNTARSVLASRHE